MLVRDDYEFYRGNAGKCYFCQNDATNIHYNPPLYDRRAKGIHGEMKAYHVCPKCLGRCQRIATGSHQEIIEYVSNLEERGSKRGRVKRVDFSKEEIVPTFRFNVSKLNKGKEQFVMILDGKHHAVKYFERVGEVIYVTLKPLACLESTAQGTFQPERSSQEHPDSPGLLSTLTAGAPAYDKEHGSGGEAAEHGSQGEVLRPRSLEEYLKEIEDENP